MNLLRVGTSTTAGIPELPSGNITGTVTYSTGDTFISSGTTATKFDEEFSIGDYIVLGTVVRRVVGIYGPDKMELNLAFTTGGTNRTAKVLGNGEMAKLMEIEAVGGTLTISTETSDTVTLTNGNVRTLKNNIGIGPVIITTGASTAAEIIYV